MAFVVDTVAALGVGDYDGQLKVIKYGPPGQEERHGMRWRADLTKWVSKPLPMIVNRDGWILDADANLTTGSVWGYLSQPLPPKGQFGQSSYAWNPRAIRHADAAFAAGLKLQENMILDGWCWYPTDQLYIATVLYPMSEGDWISNVLLPEPYIGIQLQLLQGLRRFQTSGWDYSGVQASAKENLAPHLYCRRPVYTGGPNSIEWVYVAWRWISA